VDLILCWFIAPVALLATAAGLSLLLEKASGFGVPWTIRPVLGMAVMIVIAQFGTATGTTARLTLPLIIVLAALGFLLGRRLAAPLPGGVIIGAAAVLLILFASPFLVSGEATWAGYIKLDDNATWLAITNHVFEHGRALGSEPPSTHQQILTDYLGGSYPIGAFVPMAVMTELTGQDLAFTLQPSMAVAAVMLALVLFELSRRLGQGIGVSALVAVVAPLSALLLGYYLWGGVKELVMAALLPLGPYLAARADDEEWPRGASIGIAVTIAAIIAVLGPGGVLWAVPPLIPALVVLLRKHGLSASARIVAPVAVLALVLLLPVIFTPNGIFDPLEEGVTGEAEIGNLLHPLSLLQVAGVWPSLDFRTSPELEAPIKALAILVLLLAAWAVVAALRLPERVGIPLVGYIVGGIVGALCIIHFGSTWVDAKVLATLSPGMLAAALLGIFMIRDSTGLRLETGVAAAILVLVVAWGAFRAYQGVWLAPRDHYLELTRIDDEFDGQGPTLSTEVSGYGPRYFLRDLDPEGASDRRRRQVLLVDGSVPEDGEYVDLDRIRSDQLDPYNLLVIRRGPSTSRPGAEFGLAYSGEHYEVWKRREQPPGTLIRHLPLGTELDAGAIPACSEVRELSEEAGADGSLIAARVGEPIAIGFEESTHPSGWTIPSTYTFAPDGSGRLTTPFTVPGGEYELWLGGVVFGGIDLSIDGEKVASERGVLNNYGGLEELATISLDPGRHELVIDYHGAGLWPGSAVDPYEVGPLELRPPQQGDLGLVAVDPANYRKLCGTRWDWVEAYEG
jgi:hypothetical protein